MISNTLALICILVIEGKLKVMQQFNTFSRLTPVPPSLLWGSSKDISGSPTSFERLPSEEGYAKLGSIVTPPVHLQSL